MLPVTHYLYLALGLFCVGLAGALLRRSLVAALVGVQLMLLALVLWFCAYARFFVDGSGQIAALLVAVVAVVELAIVVAVVLRSQQAGGDPRVLDDWPNPEAE